MMFFGEHYIRYVRPLKGIKYQEIQIWKQNFPGDPDKPWKQKIY